MKNETKILKPVEGKRFLIEYFTVTKEDVERVQLRDMIKGTAEYEDFHSGKYVRLRDKTISENLGVIMSNTPMELKTNQEFIDKANGDVLIAGLGLGLVLLAIQDKQNIKTITVIEKEQEIIDLVKPQLPLNDKVMIIKADIFNWTTDKKFDTIYFDIWNNICGDNYPEMVKLHRKFKWKLNRNNPNCFMDSWRRDDCKRLN